MGGILHRLISLSPCRGDIEVEIDPERPRPIDADLQVPEPVNSRPYGWSRVPFETTMSDLLEDWRERVLRNKAYSPAKTEPHQQVRLHLATGAAASWVRARRALRAEGDENVIVLTRADCDLVDTAATFAEFERRRRIMSSTPPRASTASWAKLKN